jgi:hypothetical protein
MGNFTTFLNLVSHALGSRAKSVLVLFALTFVLASCGGSSGPSGGKGPLPTAKLTAAPSSIVTGQNVTLTWVSTNADSGTIDQGVGPVGLNGSTVLTPGGPGYPVAPSTTFTYTVTGPGGTAASPAMVTVSLVSSFDGLRQSDGAVGDDVDPNGAVGIKQYMEYVNTAVQAYDKSTGTPVWTTGAKQIYTLWPPKSPCYVEPSGTPAIQLDVHIIYDRLGSRWVVGAKTSDPNAGYYFCLAVSSGDDLTTATWAGYNSSRLDSILGTNPINNKVNATDWPKIATWSDASGAQSAYYETADLESVNSDGTIGSEVGALVCAFDRPDILNNPASIKPELCVNVSAMNPAQTSDGIFLAHSLIPADIDGTTPAPAGRDEFMVSIENPANPLSGGPTTSDTINLWDFHVDWTVPSLTATQSSLQVQPYTPGCYLASPGFPSVTNCVTEPAPAGANYGQHIDSVGDRLMPRFAYRNFMSTLGYESFLVSHAVQVTGGQNSEQTGIRWYELHGDGSSAPTVSQQGTIDTDPNLFRFLPSIAEDHLGNAAVAYSYSNTNTNPGINMSYWNLGSASTPTEITMVNGESFEINPGPTYVGAWGTYSSMTVDPTDDCTFWYVNEYFVAGNLWRTSIDNFALPGCM